MRFVQVEAIESNHIYVALLGKCRRVVRTALGHIWCYWANGNVVDILTDPQFGQTARVRKYRSAPNKEVGFVFFVLN